MFSIHYNSFIILSVLVYSSVGCMVSGLNLYDLCLRGCKASLCNIGTLCLSTLNFDGTLVLI